MIRYGLKSRKAVARLMRPYNDFDVYVEDSIYVGVYERIINQAIGNGARVSRVIPLGPRDVVVEAAASDNDNSRVKLYVVDGDLDLIAFRHKRRVQNLHRLGVYSLENLVFERQALEAYAEFACHRISNGAARTALDVDQLFSAVNSVLVRYFIALAIARRLDLRAREFALNPPSVSEEVAGRFVGVDVAKCRSRTLEVLAKIKSSVSRPRYFEARRAVVANLDAKRLSGIHVVSGKAFLIWYLNGRLSNASGVALQQASIVSYLSEKCTLQADPKFRRALKALGRAARA